MVEPAKGTAVRDVELWVDGQHVASGPVAGLIAWDTRSVEDGSHDLRLVAVEDSAIETRSAFRATVTVFNSDRRIEVAEVSRDVEYGEPIVLAGSAEGATQVEVRRGHQLLGAADVEDSRWSVAVPSESLGMGQVSVIVRAVYPGGRGVRSEPLAITVREPALVPAALADGPLGEGLRAVVRGKSGEARELVVTELNGVLKEIGKEEPARGEKERPKGGGKDRSRAARKDPSKDGGEGESVTLTGSLKIKKAGFHQLAIASDGWLKVSLHGKVVAEATLASGGPETFVPIGLEAGWHPIEIELRPAGRRPFLKVVMAGEQVPGVLGKGNLAH
jgi:hypothetical protein